jgi:hypothetical protein
MAAVVMSVSDEGPAVPVTYETPAASTTTPAMPAVSEAPTGIRATHCGVNSVGAADTAVAPSSPSAKATVPGLDEKGLILMDASLPSAALAHAMN